LREAGKRPLGPRCRCCFGKDMDGDRNLANGFADLDDLGCVSDGMGFDLATQGPVVGGGVMLDVAEHQLVRDPIEDQGDDRSATGRSEVLVLDIVKSVALQPRIGGIDLQLEGGELGRFLLFSTELLKAEVEAVGEEEGHGIRKAAAATRCSEGLAEHGAFHQR
jgi:hypothetical protein